MTMLSETDLSAILKLTRAHLQLELSPVHLSKLADWAVTRAVWSQTALVTNQACTEGRNYYCTGC
jgi:hypothetical protein